MLARRSLLVALLACLALPLAGCGGPKLVTVKGTVVKDGLPVEVGGMKVLQVILIPAVTKGEEYTTYPGEFVDPANGKFEVKEVPVGKYKVVVNYFDPYPMTNVLTGKFDEASTKLVVDVDGTKPIDVDIGK